MAKYKVGQRVRVIGNTTIRHYLDINSVATIRTVYIGDSYELIGISAGEDCYQSVDEKDLAPLQVPNKGNKPYTLM